MSYYIALIPSSRDINGPRDVIGSLSDISRIIIIAHYLIINTCVKYGYDFQRKRSYLINLFILYL